MKKTWFLYAALSFSLLTACEEKPSNSSSLGNEISDEEYLAEPISSDVLLEAEELITPSTITIIDPRTVEVVSSIIPQQLAYETNFELYQSTIKELAKQLAKGSDLSPGYDQPMVLDRLGEDGQIVKGNPRVILKESELVEKILAVSETGGEVQLPLYVTESNYQLEDVSSLNEVTIASFTTYFNVADKGRSKNIELSANALNNVIVGVGDYFSFNTMVGERTEANGYQPAIEIVNKEYVMGIGGGICQTSSTLFNAVDKLGLHMTERHHHSLSVGYVPAGRDATVSYGTLDFKFHNTSGIPFLLRTFYQQGMLIIEVRTSQKYKDSF